MIPRDLLVIDLGADNWSRLMTLVPEMLGRSSPAPPRALLVFYRGLKCLRAIDIGRQQPVSIGFTGVSRLEALSRESGYPVIVAVEENALMRAIGRAQRELDFRDDYVVQWRTYLRGISREWRRTIFTYPAGPRWLPVLPYRLFDLITRLLIPDDSLILLAVTESGKAWASCVLGYRGGEYWLLSSLDAVDMVEGDLRGDGLREAAGALSAKFGGTVRAVALEKEALCRAIDSRFPAASFLWALNSADMRLLNVPRRWLLEAASSALALKLLGRMQKGA